MGFCNAPNLGICSCSEAHLGLFGTHASDRTRFLEAVKPKAPTHERFLVLGVMGGSAATFTAIRQLAHAKLVPPCYLMSVFKHVYTPNIGDINCCGHWQNISSHPNISCAAPDLSYYR